MSVATSMRISLALNCASALVRALWLLLPCSAAAPMPAFSSFSTRSEEHTSELQSLMRISYAVFCLKKKKIQIGQPKAMLVQLPDANSTARSEDKPIEIQTL